MDEIDAVIKALPALPGADHGPGPRVAAFGDARLAPRQFVDNAC